MEADTQPISSRIAPEARIRTCRPALLDGGLEPDGSFEDAGPETDVARGED